MTDEARAAIFENPLRQNISSTGEVNGALYEADFLTASDFIRTPTRLNAANQNASLVAKIDVNTDEYTSLTFGATGYYSQGASYSYANSLMNWENNLDVTSYDWRAYAKFSQRFRRSEKTQSTSSTLKNCDSTKSWRTTRKVSSACKT